ncbi:MAG: twin-arginine translocase TatA/TatE family subunit [Acidimicrobiales bacterium]|nr:twin-arginine translocase TatA/TatE family subunit [Acidimicrobiales bacterium]
MDLLSPAKLLVILVVALVVLGPDKLPKVARQIGSLWSDFRAFRHRLESGVRDSFPDLPSTDSIAQAVRSPVAFLDNLADHHANEGTATTNGATAAEVTGDEVQPDVAPNRPAGTVQAEEDPPSIPGITVADPGGVVHQIRAAGHAVPDDPGLN